VSVSGSGDPHEPPGPGPGAGESAPRDDPLTPHGPGPGAGATEVPPGQPPSAAPADVPRTRTGRAFNLLIAGAIVLILLLVFILENTASVRISYFGASGHLPLGVALLLAAIGGALITGIVGAARIVQLRLHLKRRRRHVP
jgi:uncharacterized integral membrane protein